MTIPNESFQETKACEPFQNVVSSNKPVGGLSLESRLEVYNELRTVYEKKSEEVWYVLLESHLRTIGSLTVDTLAPCLVVLAEEVFGTIARILHTSKGTDLD